MVLRVKVLRKKSERLERKRWQKYVVVSEKIPAIEDLLDSVYTTMCPKPSDYEVRSALVFVFNELAKEIYGEGHVYGVQPITTANVPILKAVDRGTGIECDISVENRDGVSKSKIVHTICSIDERFGKLSLLMKAWAKAQNINSSKFKTLNSLSIILLVAFHLQTRNPPILPPFSALSKDGSDPTTIEKSVRNFANYGKSNKESVAVLFMTLLIKLLAVENLWCKGICASTYEGSWISKAWDFKVGCISVEDFTDRSQNVARAVGEKEVKQIYKCIHLSSQHISAFMQGQIEGSTLKEYLFGRSEDSTVTDGVTKNINEGGNGPKKVMAVKANQQTVPRKPASAGWDSSPTGNLGKSATKVWGGSPSGSWGKSVLDGLGGSSSGSWEKLADGLGGSTSGVIEKPTAGWGGSQSRSWGNPAVDGCEGSTPGSLEKPAAKGWGGSQSKCWGKPAVDGWGGSTSGSLEKPSANCWEGSQSRSWGKPTVDVGGGGLEKPAAKAWGGSTSGSLEKLTAKGWGGSQSSLGKPAVDVGGGLTSESLEKKPDARGWRGPQSRSWGNSTVDAGGGSTSESFEKSAAKDVGGSKWGNPAVDSWGGSTSGSLEKSTAKGWGGSSSKSWGKPAVGFWGGTIPEGSRKPDHSMHKQFSTTKRKLADQNEEATSTVRTGTSPMNGWAGGKQATSYNPMKKLKRFDNNWGGKHAGRWESTSQQPTGGGGWSLAGQNIE